MSARDPFGSDPEDLGVRARRGLLSRSEQRDLERTTEASATLRIAYEVGRDMDAATAVRGGDDALIAKAASAALARVGAPAMETGDLRPARRPARRVLGAAAIALGVLSASGMAAAFWTGMVAWPLGPAVSKPVAGEQQQPPRRPRKYARPVVPHAATEPALATEPSATPPAALPAAGPQARRNGAAELFHNANAARRSGDFSRAARLYAELRAAYPESAEGGLARVSLGQLLLARGEAAPAEREFRSYLARPRGQLSEEALLGQAQSLRSLGKTRGERESLQRLIADHPGSVYAAQARERLEAIARDDAENPAH